MSLEALGIPCPVCAQPIGAQCIDPAAWVHDPAHLVYLPEVHAERVEAAAFEDSLGQPAEDRAPITDAEILATGEV